MSYSSIGGGYYYPEIDLFEITDTNNSPEGSTSEKVVIKNSVNGRVIFPVRISKTDRLFLAANAEYINLTIACLTASIIWWKYIITNPDFKNYCENVKNTWITERVTINRQDILMFLDEWFSSEDNSASNSMKINKIHDSHWEN